MTGLVKKNEFLRARSAQVQKKRNLLRAERAANHEWACQKKSIFSSLIAEREHEKMFAGARDRERALVFAPPMDT